MSDTEAQEALEEQETQVIAVSDHSGEAPTEEEEKSSVQEDTASDDADENSEDSKESEEKEIDFKAESRKWESRSKENLKALEALQAEHAETKKQLEELEALRGEVESLKASAAKAQIGKEYGLPDNLLSFLSGSEEEMKAQAETLSSTIGQRTGGVSRLQGNTQNTTIDPWEALTQSLQENIK